MINFQVEEDPRLPQFLCSSCHKRCVDWKDFLNIVQASNETIRNEFLVTEVKVESVESMELPESLVDEQDPSNVKEETAFECTDMQEFSVSGLVLVCRSTI